MSIFVAVDTGGTFTDLVSFDVSSKSVRYTKSLTTHDHPIQAILACVDKSEVSLEDSSLFRHGTTLVINTLVERSGPVIALLTTKGFRDVLEIGRGNRTETFNLFFRRDPPLVPRELRFEINERVDGQGRPLIVPDRLEVEQLAARLAKLDISAVAISFLNSYREPAHERLVAKWLRDLMPGCFVTCGSDLTREWYEHERSTTVAANAYTGPKIGGYVSALGQELGNQGFEGQLLLMGSNGGVLSAQYSAAAPVLLVESGPVGGCIGAGAYAQALGIPNIIAFDMGGTTAKCALVGNGRFNVVSTYYAGGYGKGIPIRAPVVDIAEVGAGGGSIASLDGQNRLHVGPRSAGSSPGPVCYGRGGVEPTVTDANLLLGRLNPNRFQGGEMSLDVQAAQAAFSHLAVLLGYRGESGLLQLASGVLAITAVKMSEAIKKITVQRGRDPRDFALFAYGGGGPLHSVELARALSIPLVIIPPQAGNFSAIGMLLADIRRDESRTYPKRIEDRTMEDVAQVFSDMETKMRDSIRADFGDLPIAFDRSVEMRFVGQYHTVRVPIPFGNLVDLRQDFIDAYRIRYGHAIENAAAEIVSVHCAATASTTKPDIASFAAFAGGGTATPLETRPVFFTQPGALVQTAVYDRAQLESGFAADGPAVIEEYGSTTILGQSDRFEIGALGEIRISVDCHRRGAGK
jgi:N-methylhydantoinase A